MSVLNYEELKKEYIRMQYEEKLRNKRNKERSGDQSCEKVSDHEVSCKTRKQEFWEYLMKNS